MWLAATGFFLPLVGPGIAMIVAAGIGLPTLVYFRSTSLQRYIGSIGLYPLTILHVWRVPAAALFFFHGFRNELPPAFWLLAGVGDLIAGLYAARLFFIPGDTPYYWRFHIFGFADFVIAVGTGLTYTLLGDPRMAAVAVMPLALIPLWGVGISGASHLVAFHQLLTKERPRGPSSGA
jgi:hypothetical protein